MDQAEQLRNIIKAENKPRPTARVLTVTSGKGGVGKSNTAINLAIQFRKMGNGLSFWMQTSDWPILKLCLVRCPSGICLIWFIRERI